MYFNWNSLFNVVSPKISEYLIHCLCRIYVNYYLHIDLNGYEFRKSLGIVSLGSREKNNKETCQTERKEGDQFPMQWGSSWRDRSFWGDVYKEY